MRKVCISCHTCPRSLLDGGRLIDYFMANGWEITTNLKESSLVLLGLCAVTAEAERFSMNDHPIRIAGLGYGLITARVS